MSPPGELVEHEVEAGVRRILVLVSSRGDRFSSWMIEKFSEH